MDQSRVLVSATVESGPVPLVGELLLLRLPRPLGGLGSILNSTASTGRTRYNHHNIFVKTSFYDATLGAVFLEVFLAPSFNHPDKDDLSSTTWLLQQSPSVQDRHLPFPYIVPPAPLQPPTQTPHVFGVPLYLGGWKNSRPSWLDIGPMEVRLEVNTRFKRFQPPVLLSIHELRQISQYTEHYRMTYSVSNTVDDSSTGGDRQGTYADTTATHVGPPTQTTPDAAPPPPSQTTTATRNRGHAIPHEHVLDLWEFDENIDGIDDDEEDDDAGDSIDFEGYLKLFHPHDPHLARLVENRRREEERRLIDTVDGWVSGL